MLFCASYTICCRQFCACTPLPFFRHDFCFHGAFLRIRGKIPQCFPLLLPAASCPMVSVDVIFTRSNPDTAVKASARAADSVDNSCGRIERFSETRLVFRRRIWYSVFSKTAPLSGKKTAQSTEHTQQDAVRTCSPSRGIPRRKFKKAESIFL